MPELPEVETNVKALQPHLVDRRLTGIEIFTQKLRRPLNKSELDQLVGKKILAVRRRAKYIIVDIEGPLSLLLHLGMTGSFRITEGDEVREKHAHLFFHLDNGRVWRYLDPRKFGLVSTWKNSDGEWPAQLNSLGPEPLSDAFVGAYLKEKSSRRSVAVKNFIMNQEIVVGVGNIYASEALFSSGIHPNRPAGRISLRRFTLLANEIKAVLRRAIEMGGSTIINYRNVDGSEGRFHLELFVYGKEGETCPSCRQAQIRRLVIAGRSSFFCPRCQK